MKKQARILLMGIIDIILINLVFITAFYLRFEHDFINDYFKLYTQSLVVITAIKIIVFYYFKMYTSLWKYASIEELIQIVKALFVSNVATLSFLFLMQDHLPRSIYILVGILDVVFIGGARFSYRAIRTVKSNGFKGGFSNNDNKKRIMIIGAGDAGAMLIKELKNHTELNSKPVVIIDDDDSKLGKTINSISVLGNRDDIVRLAKKMSIDEIIIAIPSAKKKDIKSIMKECKKTRCKLKTLPGIYELIDGKITVNQIRDVQIEDILGREQVELNIEEISDYLNNKNILVTGGGGSIGSELCRQIARFSPNNLVILDIYENGVYDLQLELKRRYQELDLKVVIASVRDRKRMEEVIENNKINVVFHAAAHKHVPLMEDNPKEAIKNNVFGTLNTAQASDKFGVDRFVLISTDKAVNPTNVMGASKRICEMIIQALDKHSDTEFVAVRFGNVLGSNGSVIPLFKRQIKNGGPITVTNKDITRYFMTIPEASRLVIQAGSMARGGEIFVLDMGEPVKILDLAKDLIRLSGFEPDVDILIEIIGLRPGEKLYEELLLAEEGIQSTRHEKIFIGNPIFIDYKQLTESMEALNEIVKNGDDEEVNSLVKEIVPTYNVYDKNFDELDAHGKEVAVAEN